MARSAEGARPHCPDHLVLVGMMGAGKSTVGRMLAHRLGCRLLDTDQLVERHTGRSVREIFAEDGEAAFRDLESQVLLRALAAEEPSVIAAAGGVVLREENRRALAASSVRVVWLRADAGVLAGRVRGGGHRPLLDGDPEGVLRRLAGERDALYREVADAIISTDGRTPGEVAEAVLR